MCKALTCSFNCLTHWASLCFGKVKLLRWVFIKSSLQDWVWCRWSLVIYWPLRFVTGVCMGFFFWCNPTERNTKKTECPLPSFLPQHVVLTIQLQQGNVLADQQSLDFYETKWAHHRIYNMFPVPPTPAAPFISILSDSRACCLIL